jgi:hypothetical protein
MIYVTVWFGVQTPNSFGFMSGFKDRAMCEAEGERIKKEMAHNAEFSFYCGEVKPK